MLVETAAFESDIFRHDLSSALVLCVWRGLDFESGR
jgi:hypothetical protein